MDVRAYNSQAWDRKVSDGSPWTLPVNAETIAAARRGRWQVILTPTIPVPETWFPDLQDCDLLCLAGGGGQQGPVLAAAGARVTVFDNSPAQLGQDRLVAQREGLELTTCEGDMADLGAFADASFDVVFHPVANCFIPDIRPVWRECHRVLRPGGVLLSGFMNPAFYIFDAELIDTKGELAVTYALPYADLTDLPQDYRDKLLDDGLPLEWGHTFDDQIGGQLAAGFLLTGFFEDRFPDQMNDPISRHLPVAFATRAVKPPVR